LKPSGGLAAADGERLKRLADGCPAYRMKLPWRDGTTHVIMSDGELLEKVAALVPAAWFHLVRYFGILASAAQPTAPRTETETEKPQTRNST
jgi:hypothetical protein